MDLTVYRLLLLMGLVGQITCQIKSLSDNKVHYLEPDQAVSVPSHRYKDGPEIFCFLGHPKHIIRLWTTVQLQVSLTPAEYERFDGGNPEEVRAKYKDHVSSWNIWGQMYSWRDKNIRLSPFNQTCVGLYSEKNYRVQLVVVRVDYWKVLFLIGGLALFASASKLSSNSLFYYLTGVSVGVFASFLVLIFVMSKFVPKKPVMLSFLIGGWTVSLYLVQLIWENIRVISTEYRSYVAAYVGITGIVSFALCYRFGPVSDPRSINLIKWAMQTFALAMVFGSSEFQEASVVIVLLTLIIHNTPWSFFSFAFYKTRNLWKRYLKKPEVKFISEDEYFRQGMEETKKALDELRGYCSSPECNQWKTILKLKEPLRFAQFVEGSPHISDDEVLAFESKSSFDEDLLTDDSSS